MNKIFIFLNSKKLVDLIKLTETKLFLVSPGITNEIAIAIAQKTIENKIQSIDVIFAFGTQVIFLIPYKAFCS